MSPIVLFCLVSTVLLAERCSVCGAHTAHPQDRDTGDDRDPGDALDNFHCEHFNDPDVRKMSLRLTRKKIPTKETTYMCFRVAVPDDQAYHIIGARFLVDNYDIVHHMGLEGCHDSNLTAEAEECHQNSEKMCSQVLIIYNQGVKGSCLNRDAGIPIGKGGWKEFNIQIHWTNTKKVDNLYDASGFEIYYTPRLRKHNVSIMTIGQMTLDIPGGTESVTKAGVCSRDCTNSLFRGPINIITALNHMHFLGSRQKAILYRSGEAPFEITNEQHYTYGAPTLYQFDSPIQVRPGDELKTICNYNSTSRTEMTHFGITSRDEMCFVYFTYYPAENMIVKTPHSAARSCIQMGEDGQCSEG